MAQHIREGAHFQMRIEKKTDACAQAGMQTCKAHIQVCMAHHVPILLGSQMVLLKTHFFLLRAWFSLSKFPKGVLGRPKALNCRDLLCHGCGLPVVLRCEFGCAMALRKEAPRPCRVQVQTLNDFQNIRCWDVGFVSFAKKRSTQPNQEGLP